MEHYFGKVLHQRYHLTHKIGQGGMATVYLAQDSDAMNQVVVVKQNDLTIDLEDRQQFEQEARALIEASRDPHCPRYIPHFHAFFVESEEGWNGQYLVMDYIEGEDLESFATRLGRPLKYTEALYWLDQIMGLLEFLHARKQPIYHRDIKPSNIRISATDSTAYLVDFGISGSSHRVIGSPGYCPPEQYLGLDQCDARSEVYSLGATLYALVTNRPPTDAQARQGGKALDPINASEVKSQTGRDAIEQALKLEPKLRFPTVAELRQALKPDLQKTKPSLRAVVHPLMQLGMPPTVKADQVATWWSDQDARMMRIVLGGNNRLITGSAMANSKPSNVRLWHISPSWDAVRLLDSCPYPGGVTSVAASRDGVWAASGDWFNTIRLWNIQGGQLQSHRVFSKGHHGPIMALAFSPDGSLLATASPPSNAVVQLWEIRRQDDTPIVLARDIFARSLDFSPDGRWLAAGCDDHQIRIWDMQTRSEEKSLDAEMSKFDGSVFSAAFSPGGDLLAAGGHDRALHLFDVRDRKTRAVLKPSEWRRRPVLGAHSGMILNLAFSVQSDAIAACGDTIQISYWDIKRDRPAPSIGPFPSEVTSVVFGDQRHMIAAMKNGIVSLIQLT